MLTFKNHHRSKDKGIALIQVLILSSLLVVLGIAFTSIAQRQVASAKALQDRASAFLMAYSAKNDVVFQLSTVNHDELIRNGWNFHSSPFTLDNGVTIELQDLNGLYSLPSLVRGDDLERLLSHVVSSRDSQFAAQSIVDWLDLDNTPLASGAEQSHYDENITVRNGPILTYSELLYIKNVTVEIADFLNETTTFIPTPTFNPFSAPSAVLESLYGHRGGVTEAIKRRDSEPANIDGFKRALNVSTDEGTNYIIGPNFKISVRAKVNRSYFGQESDITIIPHIVFSIQALHNRILNR